VIKHVQGCSLFPYHILLLSCCSTSQTILAPNILIKTPQKMHSNTILFALSSAALAFASPIELQKRACPQIHVFGARETTASPGYGSAGTVVNKILAAHSGATAEAINYPACGGGSACGGVSYSSSVQKGTAAVVSAVSAFAKQCPSTELVLVGYSQVSWRHGSDMLPGGQESDSMLLGK